MANAKYFLKRFAMAYDLSGSMPYISSDERCAWKPVAQRENAICRNPGSAECKIWPG